MSLSPSNIEYLDKVWNFYPGCNHWEDGTCPLGEKCWAKRFAENPHFGGKKGNFAPHLILEKLLDPLRRKKPTRIGVNFTGDLFGDWVDPEYKLVIGGGKPCKDNIKTLRDYVFEIIRGCPYHQFFFLTKRPDNIAKWGKFPDNTWVGASVCNDEMLANAIDYLEDIQAKKWLSIEPLTGRLLDLDYSFYYSGVSWIVIGGWSGGKNPPQIEQVKEIIDAADKAGIAVFLKDNLYKLLADSHPNGEPWDNTFWYDMSHLRQEFPTVNKNLTVQPIENIEELVVNDG